MTNTSDELLERAVIDRVIAEGFQNVWHIPAAVAIAWWREKYGTGFNSEQVTRDLVLNTLTDYVGEFGSARDALRHAALEAYPKPGTDDAAKATNAGFKTIDLDAFPFSFIDWDKAAADYMAYGVKVIAGRHFFDATGAAWRLTSVF